MSTKIEDQSDTDGVTSSRTLHGADARTNHPLGVVATEVPKRTGSEYYDRLLWKLSKPIEESQGVGFLLGLTTSDARTDSSLLAANLAIRAADQGMTPVLLIDANRRSPKLHRHMNTKAKTGLADVVAGRQSLRDCVHATSTKGLHLLSLGSDKQWDFTPILQQGFTGLINELREDYLLVVVNLPTAQELNHALPLASELDAALLVLRSEQVDARTAQAAARSLKVDGVNVVGAVVTDQRQYLPGWVKRWL